MVVGRTHQDRIVRGIVKIDGGIAGPYRTCMQDIGHSRIYSKSHWISNGKLLSIVDKYGEGCVVGLSCFGYIE